MRKIFIILLILVVITGGFLLYLRQRQLKDFEPLIKLKLNHLVEDASNGLYHLDIEKLETNVISAKISLINAHLRPDTVVYARLEKLQKAPNDLFDVVISQMGINEVAPVDFLNNKVISLRHLFIGNPVVKVWHKKHAYNLESKDSAMTVFQRLRQDVKSIQIDTITLQNVDLIYINRNLQNKQSRLNNVKLFFTDILLDSSTQYDKQRFLFAKNGLISMQQYTVNTADGLYRFLLGQINIQTNNNAMQLSGLRFEPTLPVNKFYDRLNHQQDRFNMSVKEVDFTNIDWWAMLAEESFSVKKIAMRNGRLSVYNDKSQPPDTRSKLGKYPHQLLMKLPFSIRLDTISLQQFDLTYTEKNPKSGAQGTLHFNNIRATITHVTNDSAQIRNQGLCRLTATAVFMKQAPLTATIVFDLANHKKGNFGVTASIGALNNTALNALTIPLALLKVNSLNIKSMQANIKGDNYQASGTVKLLYDNLNITALKQEGDTLKKRGLLSFIANNFILKKDNPLHGRPVRTEQAVYKRDPQKSFFNLVWKTIFTGASKTVGFNKK